MQHQHPACLSSKAIAAAVAAGDEWILDIPIGVFVYILQGCHQRTLEDIYSMVVYLIIILGMKLVGISHMLQCLLVMIS